MKFRLGTALVAAVALSSVLTAGAASASATSRPAARFASEATVYQNKVIEGALGRLPGGTRISASEARWSEGPYRTVLVAPGSAAEDPLTECLNTVSELVFCGFTKANYLGSYVYAYNTNPEGTPTQDYWVAWGEMEPDQGMYSWYNQTTTKVWREQFKDSGKELCIDPWPAGNFTDSNYTGPDVNDYWILLTTVEENC